MERCIIYNYLIILNFSKKVVGMSSEYKKEGMRSKPELKELIDNINEGSLLESSYPALEFKSQWDKKYGAKISAIANSEPQLGGWLIIGLSDQGNVIENDAKWGKSTEEKVSQQINQFLSPYSAVLDVILHQFSQGFCVFINISNQGDITEWDSESYKLTGTTSTKMNSAEKIKLSMSLPGEDYSSQPWEGDINNTLVLNFAEKVEAVSKDQPIRNLSNLSSRDLLQEWALTGKTVIGIMFGSYKVRIAKYDQNNDVISNIEKFGVYNILTDDFISEIQSWTKRQGSIIKGQTISVQEENSYPTAVLREILANAVVHALYEREEGGIIVRIYPDRLVVTNNANLNAFGFSKQWYSDDTFVRNKALMTTLRLAKITDELGTGKQRIFRKMIEFGNQEPLIEFIKKETWGTWKFTVFNNNQQKELVRLRDIFKELFPNKSKYNIAIALILWRDRKWDFICEKLDKHYLNIALEVIRGEYAPVIIVRNEVLLKRWVNLALSGKVSQRFSPSEELNVFTALQSFAFQEGREGFCTTADARNIIGLGKSRSEATQLSNLFRKWRDKELIILIKRGHWKFSNNDSDSTEDIFMPKVAPVISEKLAELFQALARKREE